MADIQNDGRGSKYTGIGSVEGIVASEMHHVVCSCCGASSRMSEDEIVEYQLDPREFDKSLDEDACGNCGCYSLAVAVIS